MIDKILSFRDNQIVDLILQGYTVPQIAIHLNLTHETVKTYKKRIYLKLGVHDKRELFAKLNELRSDS